MIVVEVIVIVKRIVMIHHEAGTVIVTTVAQVAQETTPPSTVHQWMSLDRSLHYLVAPHAVALLHFMPTSDQLVIDFYYLFPVKSLILLFHH